MLVQTPRTVEELAQEAHMSVANTSQHLQRLKQAKLVLDEREGLHICYRLADPAITRLWLHLRAVAEQQLAEVDRALDAYRQRRHGVQFRVLERQIDPRQATGWQSVSGGYVDEGWKDTVLVMPGERVKLLIKFEDYPGLFLYHCHNLEHEDMGMMRNYRVQALIQIRGI